MNNRKKGLIITVCVLILLVVAIVMIFIKLKDNSYKEDDSDGVSILGGTLPSCSSEHLNDGDYNDTNTNVIFTNINYVTDKKGNRINNSPKISKKHSVDGVVVKDLKIESEKCKEKYVTISATITNNSGKDLFEHSLAFDFVDNDNNMLNSPEVVISLKAGETIEISFQYGFRIIDAYDYSLRNVFYP